MQPPPGAFIGGYVLQMDDRNQLTNLLLLLRDAEVVCLFREDEENSVRVSMKSKGKIVINRVAMELGGGGHDFAAGLALSAPLSKTVSAVTQRIQTLIDNFERFGK